MSPRAILSPEKIEKFVRIAPLTLLECVERANEHGTYFTAHCKVTYSQDYDIESDKGIGANADAPALDGVVDVSANARVGVEKDREGEMEITFEMEFWSNAALGEGPK